jgi:hypothetical protein
MQRQLIEQQIAQQYHSRATIKKVERIITIPVVVHVVYNLAVSKYK